jgi:positive regulator of sigma E activity
MRNPAAVCFGCLGTECRRKADDITVENPFGLELAVGQMVEIELSSEDALFQAVISLCPPLLGFAAAYLLCGFFAPASGEPLRAACGVLGLFTAGLVLYRFHRRFHRRFAVRALPRITRILASNGYQPVSIDESGDR